MNTSELWKSGINDEYCWEHEGTHNGGWECLRCRLEVTLGEFFAGIAKLVEETLFQAFEHSLIEWTPDDGQPESFDAECEIEYHPSMVGIRNDDDYLVTFNKQLMCFINSGTMQTWTSTRIDTHSALES